MLFRRPEQFTVAKPHVPNATCANCGRRLSWKQIKEVSTQYITTCNSCGQKRDCFDINVEVRYDNRHLLTYTPRYWWHVTKSANWHSDPKLDELFVHVGTQQTVKFYHDLLVANDDWKGDKKNIPFVHEGYFLYRVEVPKTLDVDERLAVDQNAWPVSLTDRTFPITIKYVNQVEVPGSISLLVPYRDLTNITPVRTFDCGRNNPDYKEAA